jgi:hypothetical protein
VRWVAEAKLGCWCWATWAARDTEERAWLGRVKVEGEVGRAKPHAGAGWAASCAARAGEGAGLLGWLREDLRNRPMASIGKRYVSIFLNLF